MKKRKKPYLLVTILVVAGAAVAVMNTPPSTNTAQQPPSDIPQTGKEVGNVPSKEDIASHVASDVKNPAAASPQKGLKPMPPGMDGDSGPLVLKEEQKPYKPTPNPSSTSAQWYSQETPKDLPEVKTSPSAPPKNLKAPMPPPQTTRGPVAPSTR